MKIKLLVAAALLSLSFYANPALAGDEYSFDHGPYLQEVGNKGVSFLFTTTEKGFSWVEVKKQGAPDSDAKVYYSRRDGLKEANNTFNATIWNRVQPTSTGFVLRRLQLFNLTRWCMARRSSLRGMISKPFHRELTNVLCLRPAIFTMTPAN